MGLFWIKSLVMFKVPGSINNCFVTFPYWSRTPQLWLPLGLLGTQAEEALLSPHFALLSVGADVDPPLGDARPLGLWAFPVNFYKDGLWQRGLMSLWAVHSFLCHLDCSRPSSPEYGWYLLCLHGLFLWDIAIGDFCHPNRPIRWRRNQKQVS